MKNAQLATSAFQDLQLYIQLFETAQIHPVPKRGLPMLIHLRDRAVASLLGESFSKNPTPKQPYSSSYPKSKSSSGSRGTREGEGEGEEGAEQKEDDPHDELTLSRARAQFVQAGWNKNKEKGIPVPSPTNPFYPQRGNPEIERKER